MHVPGHTSEGRPQSPRAGSSGVEGPVGDRKDTEERRSKGALMIRYVSELMSDTPSCIEQGGMLNADMELKKNNGYAR